MPDSPARSKCGPNHPGATSNLRVRKIMGLPPTHEDWTPGGRRLDPRNTRIGPPMCGDRTPEGQGHRTRHPGRGQGLRKTKDFAESRTSRNPGLRGIQDFVGFKISWDLGLRGTQDFAGPRTSWDSRLRGTQDFVGSRTLQETGTSHTPDQDLVLWCSLGEHKLSEQI